jgi:hypothetical protein
VAAKKAKFVGMHRFSRNLEFDIVSLMPGPSAYAPALLAGLMVFWSAEPMVSWTF